MRTIDDCHHCDCFRPTDRQDLVYRDVGTCSNKFVDSLVKIYYFGVTLVLRIDSWPRPISYAFRKTIVSFPFVSFERIIKLFERYSIHRDWFIDSFILDDPVSCVWMFIWEGRQRFHFMRTTIWFRWPNYIDLILFKRLISESTNYERISTPCHLQCFWMTRTVYQYLIQWRKIFNKNSVIITLSLSKDPMYQRRRRISQ
jgi:hypothetical protein